MSPKFLAHLKRHTNEKKRLVATFMFKQDGTLRKIVADYIKQHSFPYAFAATIVPLPQRLFHDEWAKLENWLAENCTQPWMTFTYETIAFVDKADAALFLMFWSKKIAEYS